MELVRMNMNGQDFDKELGGKLENIVQDFSDKKGSEKPERLTSHQRPNHLRYKFDQEEYTKIRRLTKNTTHNCLHSVSDH